MPPRATRIRSQTVRVVHHGVLDENVDFLAKPFTTDPVLSAVARVLESPPVRRPDAGL